MSFRNFNIFACTTCLLKFCIMKNLFICFLLITVAFPLCAQKSTLPKRILKTFEEKYPGVEKVDWTIENGDYKIKFVQNGRRTTVDIGGKGSWEKTSVHIPFEELPNVVQVTVNENKKDSTIDEIKKVNNNDGETFYRVEYLSADQKIKLDISEEGKVIKMNTSSK